MDMNNDFKFFVGTTPKEDIIWRTASGRETPIEWMTTNHIENALSCLTGQGLMRIPDPYFGRTSEQWIRVFTEELSKRRNSV